MTTPVPENHGPTVLLATRNAGKLAELRRLLAGRVRVLGLADVTAFAELPETGDTFEANAISKAEQAAAVTGLPAVADDSGLTVDALNGMPGVLSARWSGRHGDDAANTALLLAQLTDVPDERRGAGFVAAVALAMPGRPTVTRRAGWRGRIVRQPRGVNGFGYDPVFVPGESDVAGDGRTSAELDPAEKDRLSHRGQALRLLLPVLLSELPAVDRRTGLAIG